MPDPADSTPEAGQSSQANPNVPMDGLSLEARSFYNAEVNKATDAVKAAEAKVEAMQNELNEADWFRQQLLGMADDPNAGPVVEQYLRGQSPAGSGESTPPIPAQTQAPAQNGQPAPGAAQQFVTPQQLRETLGQFAGNIEQKYSPYIAKLNASFVNKELQELGTKYGINAVQKHRGALAKLIQENPNLGVETAFKTVAIEDILSGAEQRGRLKGREDQSFMTGEPTAGTGDMTGTSIDAQKAEAHRLMATGKPNERSQGVKLLMEANARKQASE